MSFREFFDNFLPKSNQNNATKAGTLEERVRSLLTNENDNNLLKYTCIAGLLARVAYADMNITKEEVQTIESALNTWTDLDPAQTKSIAQIAIDEVSNLSGLDNHLYTSELRELLNETEKYEILESLFAVAASDGTAASIESEEIRIIAKGLLLEHKHFVSARATVMEHIGALKT